MPKSKYNWPALKQEFFESDIDEVKAFFEHKGYSYNRNTLKQTKGWTKEKQAVAEKLLARSIEKNIEKKADELEIPMETLKKAKMAAVTKVVNMLAKKKDPKDPNKEIEVKLSVSDMERIIKIIKTELGEPVNISKNENTNMDTIESINIVWTGGPENKN